MKTLLMMIPLISSLSLSAQQSASVVTPLTIQLDVISFERLNNAGIIDTNSNTMCNIYKINANMHYNVSTTIDSIGYVDALGNVMYEAASSDRIKFRLFPIKENLDEPALLNPGILRSYNALKTPVCILNNATNTQISSNNPDENIFALTWYPSPGFIHPYSRYTTTVIITTSSE